MARSAVTLVIPVFWVELALLANWLVMELRGYCWFSWHQLKALGICRRMA
jgi:hypothetical protein